jgi:hypothetical protein
MKPIVTLFFQNALGFIKNLQAEIMNQNFATLLLNYITRTQ